MKYITPQEASEIGRGLWEDQKSDFGFSEDQRMAFIMGSCYMFQFIGVNKEMFIRRNWTLEELQEQWRDVKNGAHEKD